jgi:hypothetical protein
VGIVPFNPKEVLKELNIQISTPTPPPSRGASTSSSMINTPHTVRHLHKKVSSVKKMLGHSDQASLIPSVQALDKLIKGCELAIYNSAMSLKELHDLRAETKVQQQKRK